MIQKVHERRDAACTQQEKNPELTSVDHANRLQAVMHGLVEGQSDDIREWFFNDCLFTTSHLDLKESSKPAVEVQTRSNGGFPPEIAALVFSHLDLQSCVALREASTSWFAIFQGSEHVLRDKLRQRNPWMRPEGDMTSWADCVLVFVKRLASWTGVTSLDQIKVKSNPIKPKINVRAVDLKHKEQLPEGFVDLENHSHDCSSYCGRLHLTHDMVKDECATVPLNPEYPPEQCEWIRKTCDMSKALLDPHAQSLRFEPLEKMTLVAQEDDALVYRAYGVEMTLPRHVRNNKMTVRFFNNHVVLRTNNSTFIFPRGKNTLHYKNAVELRFRFEEDKEVGPVYVGCHTEARQHTLMDPFRPGFVPFGAKLPLAFYNGLIWYANNRDIIPTFMDLQTGKFYYKQEAVITTGTGNPHSSPTDWRGSQVPKAPICHPVLQDGSSGLTILDLRTGQQTFVENPDYDAGSVSDNFSSWFPGYVGDKFHIKRIPHEVTKLYTMDAYGLEEDELDYSWQEDRWSQMEEVDPLTFFA